MEEVSVNRYRWAHAVLAAVVVVGWVAFAAPASAIIVRLSNGHYLSYMAMTPRHATSGANSGTGPAPSQAAPSCANCDSINHGLDYGGGPVMTSNTNYVIAWIPHTSTAQYAGNPFQDHGFDPNLTCTSGDNCGYMDGVAQFFIDLAHDSGSASNSDSVATQYNQANPDAATAYTSHFGACASNCGTNAPNGVFLDTDAIPGNASGCPETATNAGGGDAKGSGGFCITDAQIQTELNNFLSAHNLSRGFTNEYFLLTPPDVVTCEDQQGTSCSGNAPSGHAKFCGYHSFGGPANNGFLYANIPDSSGTTTSTSNDGINGCDPFATAPICNVGVVCYYNQTLAEGSLSAVSHEHLESVTDPVPPWGWNDDESNSPYQGGDEIGDLCNGDAPDDSQTNDQFNSSSFTYTPYNYSIGGDHYWLQMEWSNQGSSCMHSLTPDTQPGAAFIVSSQNGDNVMFNAASSCGNASCAWPIGEFVWQTDDFLQNGVPTGGINGLVHTVTCPFTPSAGDPAGCNGEFFTHTFPKPGTYNVALTTQTSDGRSAGTELAVHIYAAPKPHLTVTTPDLAGKAIHFSSAGTTHDPALAIQSYLWHFGDGSASTAANPTHTYARPGTYTVSLTVTDSKGQTGSKSGPLTVAASCRVPNVKGKTQSAAKTAITAAGCTLGSVHKPSRKTGSRLVVGSQSPSAGSVVRRGTAVSLTMVWQ
jgi:PKD repeat protein